MIVREVIGISIKTYSDEGKYIRKVGTDEIYSEAIDVDYADYKYVETDIEIENYEEFLDEPIQ